MGINCREIDLCLKQIGIKAIEAVECVEISDFAFTWKLELVVPRLLGCRKFACYTVGGVETL
jgi:hypothetical protein